MLIAPRPDAGPLAERRARGAREPGANAVGRVGALPAERGDDRAGGGHYGGRQLATLVCFLVSEAGEYLSGCRLELGAREVRRSAAGALLVALALAGCGSSKPRVVRTRAVLTTVTPPDAATPPPKPRAKPKPKPKPQPNPGSLPQTDQLPSADTAASSTPRWRPCGRAFRRTRCAPAMPAFFPEGAYVQVKAIADPRGDYAGRLVAEYRLDLGAAHALLGADARSAQPRRREASPELRALGAPEACSTASATTRCRTRGSSTARTAPFARLASPR